MRRIPTLPGTLALALCLSGCFGWPDPSRSVDPPMTTGSPNSAARPLYMAYEQLREPVTFRTDIPIKEFGKIYVYGDYLFINARNAGIHIFDNQNPKAPVRLGFLKIPGNLDMAVKDGILYADSYVDMVAVDLRDTAAPREIARFKDVFPYDAYQSIGGSVWLSELDQTRGVVVGYE